MVGKLTNVSNDRIGTLQKMFVDTVLVLSVWSVNLLLALAILFVNGQNNQSLCHA
jgi:hypothetical protein